MLEFDTTITKVWKSATAIVSFEFESVVTHPDYAGAEASFGGNPLVDLPLDTDLVEYVQEQYRRTPHFVSHMMDHLSFEKIKLDSTSEEALPASPLSQPLNRIQFEFMVNKLGLSITQIEAAIDKVSSMSEDDKILAKVLIRSGSNFIRSHPFMQLVPPLAGVTENALDDAWIAGTKVTW